jgi:hypothetical protein
MDKAGVRRGLRRTAGYESRHRSPELRSRRQQACHHISAHLRAAHLQPQSLFLILAGELLPGKNKIGNSPGWTGYTGYSPANIDDF